MQWNSGDHIALEMTGNGLPFRVYPAIVVADSPGWLAFYIPADTPYLRLVTAEGLDLPRVAKVSELARMAKKLVVRDFGKRHRLVVARPGEHYAVDINWTEPGWDHVEWYVNMQTPFERTLTGFSTTDQVLDIVIAPDRSWSFKDMNELTDSVASGRLAPDEAASVESEAERNRGMELAVRRWLRELANARGMDTPLPASGMARQGGHSMSERPPGTPIEVTFLVADDPFLIMPVTVVSDRDDLISHYLADGTRYLRREARDGSPPPRVIPPEEIGTVPTRMVEDTWRGSHRLVVTRPGQAHAVFLKWTSEWVFREWYVNLQEPLVRTDRGFDTRDNFLDIQVSPDRSWRWKDEDELELAVDLGRRTRQQAEAIQREAESIIPDIEAGRFPFDGSLANWRPEPDWPIPRLSLDDS